MHNHRPIHLSNIHSAYNVVVFDDLSAEDIAHEEQFIPGIDHSAEDGFSETLDFTSDDESDDEDGDDIDEDDFEVTYLPLI
jgi:hypothetical protein